MEIVLSNCAHFESDHFIISNVTSCTTNLPQKNENMLRRINLRINASPFLNLINSDCFVRVFLNFRILTYVMFDQITIDTGRTTRKYEQGRKPDFSGNLFFVYFVSGYNIIKIKLASQIDLKNQKKIQSNIQQLLIFYSKSSIGCTVYQPNQTYV